MKRNAASGLFSKLEIIFCVFLAENNFVNALIPFIGVTKSSGVDGVQNAEQRNIQGSDLIGNIFLVEVVHYFPGIFTG